MQVKPVAKKIQVYVSAYVPERKRSVQLMAGSFDRYDLPKKVPDDLAKGMYDALAKLLPDDQAKDKAVDEAKELQDWLDAQHEAAQQARVENAGRMAAYYLGSAASSAETAESISAEEAAQMFAAWDRIARVLRRGGHRRPKVKAAPKPDPRQASLV